MARYKRPDDPDRFGFDWGQLWVRRLGQFGMTRVVEVSSEHHRLEIYVSATGRSVRVWKDGKELK